MASNAPPIIAKLRRCLDGKDGAQLKADMDAARGRVAAARAAAPDLDRRTAAAVGYSRDHRLAPGKDATGSADCQQPAPAAHNMEWDW